MVCSLCNYPGHNKVTCPIPLNPVAPLEGLAGCINIFKEPKVIKVKKVKKVKKVTRKVTKSLDGLAGCQIFDEPDGWSGFDSETGEDDVTSVGGLRNERLMVERFRSDTVYRRLVCNTRLQLDLSDEDLHETKMVHSSEYKNHGIVVAHTSRFQALKLGTNESSATSKSDVCIISPHGDQYPISLKSGPGRLTSADCYETNANFMCCSTESLGSDIVYRDAMLDLGVKCGKHKVEGNVFSTLEALKLKKKMKEEGADYKGPITELRKPGLPGECTASTESRTYVRNMDMTKNKQNDIFKKLKISQYDYLTDVLYECASGSHKFGKSACRADFMLVLLGGAGAKHGGESTDIIEHYDLRVKSSELDTYLWGCVSDRPFRGKSSNADMWLSFL